MDIKGVAKATTKTLISYLTYEAMRIVAMQLDQTNPPLAHWLRGFSSTGKLQDGDTYLQEMLQSKQEVAFRLMTVRQHLAQEISEFLPEMLRSEMEQSNTKLRCAHLDRLVNTTADNVPEWDKLDQE
ncbi:MAG: RbcX chaperonin protein [Cyanobacteria bacterium M5B4]|nr:MAG: RbcX chaperonin protein [Cyanobacteria bacterium M5B4]